MDALLIGYERQENLGLRSIVAYLKSQGYESAIYPFAPGGEERVLAEVEKYRPRLVGFSIIFQYSLDEFGRLIRFLRNRGVAAHFTAGGHFPSLRPQDTFELLPDLDSIIRFEGELTLCELLQRIEQPERWHRIQGIAFRNGAGVVVNPPRALVDNLDNLPLIHRDQPLETPHGIKMAAMLASRGCLFNCSFCSIRQFYRGSPGAARRVRSPQAVADEMLHLFEHSDIRLFSFQDDDFAARTTQQREWMGNFLKELDKRKLSRRVRWKISCRVDDLDGDILIAMQDRGLMTIYLGVESGSEAGLRVLNKKVTVEQNLRAVDLVKQHGIALAIGFMLFDPSTTVFTIRENLTFLRQVGDDGYFPINFCKMLPYAGTPIEAQLRATGRLTGTTACPDYPFLDPALDWYEFIVQRIFQRRNFSPRGLVALLQQAKFDWHLANSFDPSCLDYDRMLQDVTAQANRQVVETLSMLLDELISRGAEALIKEQDFLVELAERQWQSEMRAEVALSKMAAGKSFNFSQTPP